MVSGRWHLHVSTNKVGTRDLIELQLAHAERNKVRAAYNRATRLAERRKMMQAWADYLDTLRAGAEIIPFRQTKHSSLA